MIYYMMVLYYMVKAPINFLFIYKYNKISTYDIPLIFF